MGARASTLEGKGKLDPTQMFLSLHSADDDDAAGEFCWAKGFLPCNVAADGSFEWKSVFFRDITTCSLPEMRVLRRLVF